MVNKTLLIFAAALLLLTACTHGIKPEALYGNWKYIKIDKPKSDDPTDTTSAADLATYAPYISFTPKNELFIHWGGEIISHGTFTIAANDINYTEQLTDGTKRTFPFYVSKLDDKTMVFETLDKNGSRVTAVRK
ncbi:MAG: hypothetical protein V4592_23295 [Bacteroidota bacterium]